MKNLTKVSAKPTEKSSFILFCLVLTQYYIDFYEFTNDVLPGDAYLLCSDGLNDMITDLEIEELMVANKSANQLCEAAIEAGGFDNVSTCVFHIDK